MRFYSCILFLFFISSIIAQHSKSAFDFIEPIPEQVDFSGTWIPKLSIEDSSYEFKIVRNNEGYIGYFCFMDQGGSRRDCSENPNMLIIDHSNSLEVALLSTMGGLTEGEISVIDENTILWQAKMKMGNQITPNSILLGKKEGLVFQNPENFLLKLPLVNTDISDKHIKSLEDVNIKLNPEYSTFENVYIAAISDVYFHYKLYILLEYNSLDELMNQYIITVNREGSEVSRIQVYHNESINDSEEQRILNGYEISEDFKTSIHSNFYKKGNLKKEIEQYYTINSNGSFIQESDNIETIIKNNPLEFIKEFIHKHIKKPKASH